MVWLGHFSRMATFSMKDWFDESRSRATAAVLAGLHPRFSVERFLAHVLDGLAERELMARMHRMAEAFHLALPVGLPEQVEVLRAYAPQVGHNFVGIWPCAHVAARGLDQPEVALPALRELTRYGSAEFAVRPFLARDLAGTLAIMTPWAEDPDEHVRRLASEGTRPRLPWGQALTALIADPRPTRPILERLRADPALYVRKSVANHLNDIAKDHPDVTLALAREWSEAGVLPAETQWIVRHGLRTLVKRGDRGALALLGAGAEARVAATLKVTPPRLKLGQRLTLEAVISSTARRAQTLEIDYVVHYARATGRRTEKVFKWKRVELAAGETLSLKKAQLFKDFSTRKHYAGEHGVELQINGRRLDAASFDLVGAGSGSA